MVVGITNYYLLFPDRFQLGSMSGIAQCRFVFCSAPPVPWSPITQIKLQNSYHGDRVASENGCL